MKTITMNPQNWVKTEAKLQLYADGKTFQIYGSEKFELRKCGKDHFEIWRPEEKRFPMGHVIRFTGEGSWDGLWHAMEQFNALDTGLERESDNPDPRVAAALLLWNIV